MVAETTAASPADHHTGSRGTYARRQTRSSPGTSTNAAGTADDHTTCIHARPSLVHIAQPASSYASPTAVPTPTSSARVRRLLVHARSSRTPGTVTKAPM